MQKNTILLLTALGLTVCACDSDSSPDSTEARVAKVEAVDTDWKSTAQANAQAFRIADPQRFAQVDDLTPITTRKGTLLFVGDAVRNPQAADVLLSRLAAGEDDPAMRAALVEALPRTGGEFGPAIIAMLAEESDPELRVVMLGTLQRADASSAHVGLRAGLEDADPLVRAEAARVASMRADGSALATDLRRALLDEVPAVRAAAARTSGVLGLSDTRELLVEGLDDANAEVRLQALRAVGRIDPSFAKGLDLSELRVDGDARVAGVAQRLSQ